ncbi:MAG: LysM peptidoglycan-binding domain-containing protein [Puniceicoccales bacterium]|jgi:LysM repeat protein|nr:LysM peptidoglycan-binding domain-containing protein [Puniceicoccales bacterium]
MLKSIFFSIFIGCAVASAKPTQKNTQDFVEIFNEKHENLQKEVTALKTELRNVEKEIGRLTNKINSLIDRQTTQTTNTIKEILQKEGGTSVTEIADQRIKVAFVALSQEFNCLIEKLSQEVNALSGKVIDAVTSITSMANAQQQLSTTMMGSATKQFNGIVYEVKLGDTLDKVAEKFNVTQNQIKDANLLINENHLVAGQVISIPK